RQPTIACRHAKLHSHTRRRHRQIESMLELDLLGLGEAELAGDIRDRLLRKHDRSRPRRANEADKLNVFDGLGESLQAAAILLEKSHASPIDLAVDQQPNQ